MKRVLFAAILLVATSADPNGLGQALIYPYYTARAANGNAWNTALSVVSTRAKPKVLKVRFREGKNARIVMEANVYLGPYDVWTAAVVPGTDGAAHLVSADASCIDPPHSGTDAGAFSTASFTASASDGAGTGVDRTLEGFVEVIEMGTLSGATATAVSMPVVSGQPNTFDCPSVVGTGKTRSIDAPEGGLSGTAFLINVNSGLAIPYAAVALADLTQAAFYSDVGASGTDYDSPQVTPLSVVTIPSSATTGFGTSPAGYLLRSNWSGGVDAVSAVLMAASVQNEFVLEFQTTSITEWVLTSPTSRFYVDGASPAPPFDAEFGASGACETIAWTTFNREQARMVDIGGFFPELPPPVPALCWASTIVSFRNGSTYAPSSPTLPSLLLDSSNAIEFPVTPTPDFVAGYAMISPSPSAPGLTSLPSSTAIDLATGAASTGAHKFAGLPVVGFAGWKFDNGSLSCAGQVCKGSFGVAYPHHMIPAVTRIAP